MITESMIHFHAKYFCQNCKEIAGFELKVHYGSFCRLISDQATKQ